MPSQLTDEELECLRSCARGNSLRFENPDLVNALIEAGFVQRSVGGVVTVTTKGLQYLLTKFADERE